MGSCWALVVVALLASACGRSTLKSGFSGTLENERDGGDVGPDRRFIGQDHPLAEDRSTIGLDRPLGEERPIGRDREVGRDRPVGRDTDNSDNGFTGCREDCESFSTACLRVFCDSNSGQCRREPAPPGTLCDDGDPCTLRDQCQMASCFGRAPLDCSALTNGCTVGVCDSNRGGCVPQAAPDGQRCDDGLMCTIDDICRMGQCVSGTQTGACANPHPIPLVVGSSTVSAPLDFCGVDEVQPICAMFSGPDVVFALANDGPRRVSARSADPIMQALVVSNGCGNGRDLTCQLPASDPSPQLFLERGPAFFILDHQMSASAAAVSLNLVIDPHDTCSGAIDIPLPLPGRSVELRGITSGANNDFFTSTCAGGCGSSDHVYRLAVQAPTAVELRMVPPMGAMTYDAAMYLFNGPCASGMIQPIACDDDLAGNFQPLIEAVLPPGEYFVVIDGFGANQSGEYNLRVTQQVQTLALTFPEIGDARLEQIGGLFSQDGDFVEGARRPPIASVGSAQIDLQVQNRLMCDSVDVLVSINGTGIDTFSITSGQQRVSRNVVFPALGGPNFSIRYEVTRDVVMSCGGVDFPDGVSTITLGP